MTCGSERFSRDFFVVRITARFIMPQVDSAYRAAADDADIALLPKGQKPDPAEGRFRVPCCLVFSFNYLWVIDSGFKWRPSGKKQHPISA